jgi:ADP-ribose pyrophosphatase YjhB (NUDIX family)/predicted transcriptional regulator
MTEAELKKAILNKLMFVNEISYGELHKVTKNHDLFNYHLRELVSKGFVNKNGSNYSLTVLGKQQVSHMEEDGQYQKQIKVGMFIDVIRKQNEKWQMLLHRRLKHPHYGYIGSITAKLRWGDSIPENLIRELKEEIDVTPTEYSFTGVVREVFRNEHGEKVGDGVFFVIAVTKWEGNPQEKSVEGEYFWHDIDDILNLDKIFRGGFEKGLPHLERFIDDPQNYVPYIYENNDDKLNY